LRGNVIVTNPKRKFRLHKKKKRETPNTSTVTMGNVGRFFCVAFPFILTAASLISLLIVGLTGISNTGLSMFSVNTTELSINPANLQNFLRISNRDVNTGLEARFLEELKEVGTQGSATDGGNGGSRTENITATDLDLGKNYLFHLWGYCVTFQNNSFSCSQPRFDWASEAFNTSVVTGAGAAAGVNVTLPSELTTGLNAFKTLSKWTEVVFIVAVAAVGLELLVGLFTSCSRIVSCITWLLSGVATIAIIANAAMITAMSVAVVGAIEGTARWYGVRGSITTSYLAVAWIAAAFALAASLFWLFSACCCKPERRERRRNRGGPESEKFIPNTGSGYAPLHDDNSRFSQASYGAPRHQQGGPRSAAAYEPYSHSNV
jgi:hypothetical protein